MGATKLVHGDNHIVYHVGKELPEKGSSMILVPGMQNAQGRGIYFSEEPQLKYSGGEHYQEALDITPIYCVPMVGMRRKGVLKKKNNQVVYHTEGRVIDLKNLQYVESTNQEGKKRRYYYSLESTFYAEPKTQIYDEFSGKVRTGRITTTEAEALLQNSQSETIDQRDIQTSLETAVSKGLMPPIMELRNEINKEFSTETQSEFIFPQKIEAPKEIIGYGVENGG